jgi:GNAT superfamily N-acetyltransferase
MSKVILTAIDLHNQSEFLEFLEQRILCGWSYTIPTIENWREQIDLKQKTLFWISPSDTPDIRAGHISLDSTSNPPDPTSALPDKTLLTVQNLFIHPSYSSLGFGGHAMDAIESFAKEEPFGSPNCKALTLNSLTQECLDENLPVWLEMWKEKGVERPAWSFWSKVGWYERKGYVKWKEVVKKEQDSEAGKVAEIRLAYLRKELQ